MKSSRKKVSTGKVTLRWVVFIGVMFVLDVLYTKGACFLAAVCAGRDLVDAMCK